MSPSSPTAEQMATSNTTQGGANQKVQQPKPQALPTRNSPAAILVSPRQKGNPILNSVRSVSWEYSDIPADYVLGATTCALFLSLKYHRLHPEYIYGRIKQLMGKYHLRILLVIVDIDNHEEPLRELSKTSLINNLTIVLTWSATEAGRYLELFKLYEHVPPTGIRGPQQSTSFGDQMVNFVTAPKSINKTDAVGLVSNFGSLRTAINARPEEISLVAGWGEKKVERWCNAVKEPFRIKVAARRELLDRDKDKAKGVPQGRGAMLPPPADRVPLTTASSGTELERENEIDEADEIDDAWRLSDISRTTASQVPAAADTGCGDAAASDTHPLATGKRPRPTEDGLSDGVASALAKLREKG